MKTYTFFETNSKNSYLYSKDNLYLINIHPAISLINHLIHNNDEKYIRTVLRQKFPEMPENEISFYLSKYYFLHKHGFFETIDFDKILSGGITAKTIEDQMINLNNIVFQVTNNCNLRCKYCCFGELYNRGDASESISLEFNAVRILFNFIIPYWNSATYSSPQRTILIGFYGGEPLLNFSLITQIVTFCNNLQLKYKTKFAYSITTNATLLDKYSKYLVNNDFKILISLDGDEKADSLRVDKNNKASFKKVYKNIKKLQTDYPEFFRNKVEFNSVLNSKTTSEYVHNFIYNEFGKIPMITSISSVELNEKHITDYKEIAQIPRENIKLVEQRRVKSATFKELGSFFYYHLNNSFKHYSEVLYPKALVQNQIPTGTCLPFNKKMYITADKKILVCERIGFQHTLGYIDDKVNINFQNIVDVYTSHYQEIKKQCLSCYFADRCSECMLQFSSNQNNELVCHKHCGEEGYKDYLSTLITLLEARPDFFNEINKMVFA